MRYIRWMIERDLPRAIEIEEQWFGEFGWLNAEFRGFLKKPSNIGLVAEGDDGEVVGYALYTLYENSMSVDRLVVDRNKARTGIGRDLLSNLIKKVTGHVRRNKIYFNVGERDLDTQLWLKACGIKCERIVKGGFWFGDSAFQFVFRGKKDAPFNRISGYLTGAERR
jgi:hypothetical protein